MDEADGTDRVVLVPNGGWDPRILICRCAPTVDSFIVVTTRYVIVIDTLLNLATATTLLDIARPYLCDGRTLLVLNTHADWDHCWGNQLFAGPTALAPAPIVAHARGVARYGTEMTEQLRANRSAHPGRFDAVVPVPPTITFEDRLTIDGGDLTLALFPAPGHTDDHLAIFIPEIGTLFAGDAAEEPFPFATTVEGLVALRATLRELSALQARVALYCHAPEWVDPALIGRNTAYFDLLEERCRAALARDPDLGANGDNLEQRIQWPLEDVSGSSRTLGTLAAMYHDGHKQHITLMLHWLLQLD